MERYVFPAIFDPDSSGRGFTVTFPDLPGCITEADSLEEAFQMAKEALALHIWSNEDDGEPIPTPASPLSVSIPPGGFVSLIEAWMPPIRDRMANKAVNKMLTLPKWLNDLAEANNVNFSRILQNALKDHLGVAEMHTPYKSRP